MEIQFVLNDKQVKAEVGADTILLNVLRDVGCDRDGLRNGFGIDEDRRFVRVAYFGGDGNGSFRRDDRRSFDRSFLSF